MTRRRAHRCCLAFEAPAQQLERPDYEDGIVVACARAEGVDAIVTRDATAFASAGVGRYAPRELIDALGYEGIEL